MSLLTKERGEGTRCHTLLGLPDTSGQTIRDAAALTRRTGPERWCLRQRLAFLPAGHRFDWYTLTMSTSPVSSQPKMHTLTVELPESVVRKLGQTTAEATRHLAELAVIELFRQGELSGGKSAELLSLGRADWLSLLARHGVPHTDVTEDDLDHDLKALADWKSRTSTLSRTPDR
jgi:predicted HTH domain antitoxin